MIRTDMLRGEIARAGMTQTKVAEKLGITYKTFASKMKKGIFNSDEIDTMIEVLKIEEPARIFFAKKVSQ